jgi:uncharacterized repeat protein (TIGR03803 family)
MRNLDQPGGMVEGSPGVFYSEAGSSTHAALSITPQGTKTILASVQSPYQIPSLLVSAANGRFYSSVVQGTQPAHVFSVTSVPGSRQIYPGQSLNPGLTQNLPDGELLATAAAGTSQIVWYVAKVELNGTVTSIYQFPYTERLQTAIYASDGNYYGVSQATGAPTGYVFRVTPSGTLTKLYNFPANTFSGYFTVPLLQASDGNLYGATSNGGTNGMGTIYKLTLGGQYTLLYSFPKGNLGGPTTLIEGSDGNLYGATLGVITNGGYSQLFRISKKGQFSIVYNMSSITADGACQCSLVQGSDGIIYGTAVGGGTYNGGLYFALDAGLPKPAPRAQSFNPRSGAAGTQVLIWGSDLLSASVQFNGVAATAVSNSGSNYVLATVPAGATSGSITVTTPGGTVTTHAVFTVQ